MEKLKEMEKNKEISEDDFKRHQDTVQKTIDKYSEEIDKAVEFKEKEILEV